MDAKNLGFQASSFDLALCGFMGWMENSILRRYPAILEDREYVEGIIQRVLAGKRTIIPYLPDKPYLPQRAFL
jgi:hypothetical protein